MSLKRKNTQKQRLRVAKKVRIKDKLLQELVDAFEGSYMFQQALPERVGLEDGQIYVSYHRLGRVTPLTKPDLFTSFAKLAAHGEPSKKQIERWVGRFGLPVWSSRSEQEDAGTDVTVPEVKPMSMAVEDFRREARYAHDLLYLYALIRGKDARAIKEWVRTLRSTIRERMRTLGSNLDGVSALDHMFLEKYRSNKHALLIEANDKRSSSFREAFPVEEVESGLRAARARLREFDNMVTVLAAQSALGEIVTDRISDVQIRAGVQRGHGLVPSYKCHDLPSAIYLQFYFLVTKNKAPRFCENPACGELFFPTRSNQRHCHGAACRSNASYHRKAETV
jgi:hypothetical protein